MRIVENTSETAIAFPDHGDTRLAPIWTPEGELLADLTVITRLTLGQGTTVVLLGGCLTLALLGLAAALCCYKRLVRLTT
ncbi:hypothetical protein ACFYWU_40855 [Streptomyces chrestomyceticus]|uniref:hypothetical protein n=1 Tax=Streptomyces chrestomyceticus TaxID=68185 RepID=UPI0036AEDA13